MTPPRILVVEDDDAVRMILQEGLLRDGFEVVASSNVSDALKHVTTERFDALLSDLHLFLAGDGFTVASAMRHAHPNALTLVLSGYLALDEALSALLSQVDEILVKPIRIGAISDLIRPFTGRARFLVIEVHPTDSEGSLPERAWRWIRNRSPQDEMTGAS